MAIIQATFFDSDVLPLLYSQSIQQKAVAFETVPGLFQGGNIISKNAMESTNKSGLIQPPTTGQLWPKFVS